MSKEITKELFQKAKQANSAEELKALAKENGVDLTDEQAAELFSKLNASGELSEDELNSVAGGGCSSSSSSSSSSDSSCSDSSHYSCGTPTPPMSMPIR